MVDEYIDDPIPGVDLALNNEQRLPCTVIVDGSTSMSGAPIDDLNTGLKAFEEALKSDPQARMSVVVQVIRIGDYGKAEVLVPWVDAIDFDAPTVIADGSTPLGAGVTLALKEIANLKAKFKNEGTTYLRPWLFTITDGAPTDSWEKPFRNLRDAERDKKLLSFPIGVEGADMQCLDQASNRPAVKLEGTKFRELFEWVSASVSATSGSSPGAQVQLPANDGWAQIAA